MSGYPGVIGSHIHHAKRYGITVLLNLFRERECSHLYLDSFTMLPENI